MTAATAASALLLPTACSSGGGGGGGGGALDAFLENESRVNTNAPGASVSEQPIVCVDGSQIYIVWRDDRTGSSRIHFNSSSNGGITWRPNDIEIPYGGTGAVDLDLNSTGSLACDGTNVYVVWEELVPGGMDDIYLNYSTDGGTTWLPVAIRLDTDAPGTGDSDEPSVAVDGTNVCVVWEDARDGQRDIRFNHSADGGATWLAADTRLDTDPPGNAGSSDPTIHMEGADAYVVWEDERNGAEDIYLNRSTDGGATWLAVDVRIDSDAAGSAISTDAVVSSSGLDVYVAWRDERNGDRDIYFNRSADGGMTWQPSDVRLDSESAGVDSEDLRIAAAGTNVYVCFKDKRNDPSDDDVFVNVSNDSGATWLPAEMRLDTSSGDSDGPRIAAQGSNVFVCWEDNSAGNDDIYLRYSTDAGATWIPSEMYVGEGPAGTFDSGGQSLACSANAVWVVWHEDRSGNLDVFVNGGEVP